MGATKDLTPGEIAHLNELTRDLPEEDRVVNAGKDGADEIGVPMRSNDAALIALRRIGGGRNSGNN